MRSCKSFGHIKSDFNLEGVNYGGENWYLFNRGNGAKQKCYFHTYKIKQEKNSAFFLARLRSPENKRGSYQLY
jgi:hypothetical protein